MTTTTARQVGSYYGEREIEVTPDLAQHYAASVDDHNPIYSGPSPFGGPVAPALTLHSECYHTVDWYLSYFGNLHARQEWEFFHPVMVGDTVLSRRQIVDRYFKRDREYVVMEVGTYAPDGRLLLRGRTHQSFVLDPNNTDRTVVDKDREKRADRKVEAAEETVLEEISGPDKEVSIEMCKLFSPGKNYHNDVEEARRLGFPDIVVQGMMSLCFISEMMTTRFGEGWIAGGRMNVNLVNVLWQGETVKAGGVVTEVLPEGDARRSNLRVWCEKADGTKVTVGSASALQMG
jgi:acyl dehydratase